MYYELRGRINGPMSWYIAFIITLESQDNLVQDILYAHK